MKNDFALFTGKGSVVNKSRIQIEGNRKKTSFGLKIVGKYGVDEIFNCMAYNDIAEKVEVQFKNGSCVFVSGRLDAKRDFGPYGEQHINIVIANFAELVNEPEMVNQDESSEAGNTQITEKVSLAASRVISSVEEVQAETISNEKPEITENNVIKEEENDHE